MILYSLVLDQFTEALKVKLSGISTFKTIAETNDTIGLLRVINEIAFKFEVHENAHVALWNLKRQVCNTFQNNLDLTQFLLEVLGKQHHHNLDWLRVWVDDKTVREKLLGVNIGSTMEMTTPSERATAEAHAKT